MSTIFTKPNKKRNYSLLTVLSVIIITISFCTLFMSYQNGPAKNSIAATGAPFKPDNGKTCSQSGCHNTQVGSFGGTVTTQLLDAGNNPVTSYQLGQTYTFRIKFNHTSGSPKYGWQTTVATVTGDVDVNTWTGTQQGITHVAKVSGRAYFEHSTPFATTTDSVRVTWIAPSVSSGPVKFYTAANFVNGNAAVTGDQVTTTTLEIGEAVLPVTLKYFRGTVNNGAAVLSWATATEVNNKNFIIEKSSNGSSFSTLTTIPCKGNSNGSNYTYTDNNFNSTAYYRLKQTDFDGHPTVFNTVQLKAANEVKYSLSAYAHAGITGLLFNNGSSQTQKISVRYSDLQGKILYSGSTTANQGDNFIAIPSGINKSIIIVSVITEDGTRTTTKVGIQR